MLEMVTVVRLDVGPATTAPRHDDHGSVTTELEAIIYKGHRE